MRFTTVFVGLVFTTVLSFANASQSTHPEHAHHNQNGGARIIVHGVSSKAASPAAVPNPGLGSEAATSGAHSQNHIATSLEGHQQGSALQAGRVADGVEPKAAASESKANSEVASESPKVAEAVEKGKTEVPKAPEGVEPKQSTDSASPAQSKMRMVRRVRRAPIVEGTFTGESALLKREIQLERLQARSGGMYESTVVKANRLARRFLGFLFNIGRKIIGSIVKHVIKNKVANNNHHRRSPIFDEVGVVGMHARSLEDEVAL